MHPDPYLHTHPSHGQQPTMSDVWLDHPASTGMLTPRGMGPTDFQHQLMPVNVAPVHAQTDVLAGARPRPHADSFEWLLVKHLVQLALVASVVLLVLEGGRSPILALAYASTGLLLMGTMVIADRQRFADRDPDFQIVEFFAPIEPARSAAPAPAPYDMPYSPHVARPMVPEPHVAYAPRPHAPLGPLVDQMQGVMPAHVDVT
jgi:hypothetical protein